MRAPPLVLTVLAPPELAEDVDPDLEAVLPDLTVEVPRPDVALLRLDDEVPVLRLAVEPLRVEEVELLRLAEDLLPEPEVERLTVPPTARDVELELLRLTEALLRLEELELLLRLTDVLLLRLEEEELLLRVEEDELLLRDDWLVERLLPLLDWSLTGVIAIAAAAAAERTILIKVFIMLNFICP